ncbi:MAG: glycosyltransferase family 2 protein [Roseburia sp.]|nr:glycosyltransferase family 2 protein [Roseburia sp.]
MPDNINVSVIIPTYNAGKQFERLLDMLYQQKGLHDVEIVVVDSGSRDETVLTAEKRECNVVKISQEQFSHSYSRNLGAENARYDYIVFMTQDALPENELWIANLVEPLLGKGEIAASTCIEQPKKEADLFSRMAIKQQADWLLEGKLDRVLQMPGELPEGETWETVIRKNGCINDVACAYRKDIFLQYRYRLNYAEDLDMGKRLIEAGHKLMLLGSVKVIHSHNRSSMYYLRRMLVERVALVQIFSDQETAALTEEEFITGTVWLYNKVVGWINEIVEMPLKWSKNAVLLDIKDICVRERGIMGQKQIKIEACPDLKDFMARLENYQKKFEGQTENQGGEKFYELYQMKMEGLIGFLWNEGNDTVSMKLLIEICEAMYCLLGNVVGTLFGDMVLGTKELKYLEQEYYTLGKGI